jgi:predicted RNase H-like HicB family nuclease
MALRTYVAVIQQEPGEANWSILVPDFPEIASVAERPEDWGPQALDAILTALDARRVDEEPVPEATPLSEVARDWPTPWPGLPLLVAVDVEPPTEAVRLNISLEKGLVQRIDAAAESRGMSRSGFLAEGARRLLRDGARS